MTSRKWYELPNRQSSGADRARTGLVAVVFSLSSLSLSGMAEENQQPSKAGAVTAVEPVKLHTATPEELKIWIDQLGSPLFSVRERAVGQLSRCDAMAIQPLRNAADESTDLEVKSRCLAIADAIYRLDVGKRTNDFLKDPDPVKTYGFDGWLAFSEVVGKSRLSKRLFAELIESHPDQANSNLPSSNTSGPSLQVEASEIFNKFRSGLSVELGDSISLLYQSIQRNGDVPSNVDQITVMLLRSTPFTTEIGRSPKRSILQKLVGSWIAITKSDPLSVLMVSIDNDISQGIDVARRVLGDRNCEPSLYLVAISVLMRFGNPEDLTILEPWRSEQRIIQNQIPVQVRLPMTVPVPDPNAPQPSLELGPTLMVRPPTEVRMHELRYQDLALAASAHLMDREDIRELFPRLQTHPTYVFRPDSLAMPQSDNEARQRIIDSLAQKPKEIPK